METKGIPVVQSSLISQKPRIWAIGIIGGLCSSIIITTFSYIASVLDVASDLFYIVNQLLFFSIGIFLCQKIFRSQNEDHMSYRQGLTIVALIGVVGAVMLATLNVFLLNYFSDNYYFEDLRIYPEKTDFLLSFYFQNILDVVKYAFVSAILVLIFTSRQQERAIR